MQSSSNNTCLFLTLGTKQTQRPTYLLFQMQLLYFSAQERVGLSIDYHINMQYEKKASL